MMNRVMIAQLLLLGFQIVFYFGCELFQKNPHNVLRDVDGKIPFLPATALIYVLWFPLILILPPVLYFTDPSVYAVYMTAAFADVILSVVCYVAYPTSFERPVPPDTWDGKLMKLVYFGSFRGVNCAPSLHCSSCYLILVCMALASGMMPWLRILSALVAAGIVISTMTTKQHALLDVVTAVPAALICLAAGFLFPAGWLLDWIAGL